MTGFLAQVRVAVVHFSTAKQKAQLIAHWLYGSAYKV
jgi:hypothetical protein